MRKQVFSVSGVNQYIKSLIRDDYALNHIYVQGEVSNCKYHSSGHVYFTLKDRGGAISCIMFASDARNLKFRLTEGLGIIAYGSVDVYERDGRYQLYVRAAQREGTGQLYEAYEALKKKLSEEGLFDASHKKPVPYYPKTLGVVTASTGAAIQDILNIARRRNPFIQIVFCSAKVQGEGSAKSVVSGIRALESYGVDVMIVGRGGGSIEDLWAFNEEIVARAVYDCKVPVISAVGHETDTTIIDFVSDLRAPTPSAAAELAVPDVFELFGKIGDYQQLLDKRMMDAIAWQRGRSAYYEQQLKTLNPVYQLNEKRQRLADLENHLRLLMDSHLRDARSTLANKTAKLSGLSPLKQLERGYAYVTDESGHGVTSTHQIGEGSKLTIAVTDGSILATVDAIKTSGRE